MELPSLPTDSAHKFLAVGLLIMAVVTSYGGYQSLNLMFDRVNERVKEMDEMYMHLARSEAAAEANDIDTAEARKKAKERAARDTGLEWRAGQEAAWLVWPGRVAAVSFLLSAIFTTGFAAAMWKWLRLQRVADLIVAFELAEAAEKWGLKIDVVLPKTIHI